MRALWIAIVSAACCIGAPALAAEPRDAWLAEVEGRIARSEYEIGWQPTTPFPDLDGAYHAPNRAHGFRAYFAPAGIRVVPREPAADAWRWDLSLAGVGRGDSSVAAGTATPRNRVSRVEYDRGEILEWYENDPSGLEQGFTLDAKPGGRASNPVAIDLALGGTLLAFPSADRRSIDFATSSGVRVLRYGSLRVEDARGTELSAWLEVRPHGIRICFDDRGAVYPVMVDPLATSPAWTAEGNQTTAHFGASLGTAGDVNGDGYSDVIVGANLYDNGQDGEGRAFVYLGSASGLATTPAWTAESDQANAFFGFAVATAGDVNGDGYSDVLVGSSQYDNGVVNEGAAFLYLGSPSGLAATAAWTVEGEGTGAQLGRAVAPAGDVNGDGRADVIVGAPLYANGETGEGRALVFLGDPAGLATAPAWTAEGNLTNALFGNAVATAGDVDGDGYADVLVGANQYSNGQNLEGRAFLYLGSAAGLATTPAWTVESDQISANLGHAVATAGDVNGDGYADVLVGCYGCDNGEVDEGRAFVYLGSAAGLATTAAWSVEGDQAGADVGHSVGTAGDVNGDGYADVIVGAFRFDNGQTDEGRAFVYLGSASGLATTAAWSVEGNQSVAEMGDPVATAGDVNGDGYSDVIVGAASFTNGQTDEGRAFVYLGSAGGLASTAGWTGEGGQIGAQLGFSVAGAFDVNGDGFADVIVGAPDFDNGQADEGRALVYLGGASGLATAASWAAEGDQAGAHFGASVAGGGDVNGDGYGDVVVGAPSYTNGQGGEGRALVYLGGASGLATSASWTAESEQAGASFGASVASAGDVNGDGYGDVVVGAPSYTNGQSGEGRAFVYLGSASGLAVSAAWTAEGDQTSASFGASVASSGDANGDGYSDVIVGAPSFDNGQTDEGRAFVYLGSTSGLAASASWTAESNQGAALFGGSVASAGDVDGNGCADAIVGAKQYDAGQTDEGRAFVYLGGPGGLATTAAWTAESNQAGALFGASVSSAGDVSGDGYSDVIVGSPSFDNGQSDEGRAFSYLGSASGLATGAASTAESDQAGAQLGGSVASAGDVNGDGYADAIVGAAFLDGSSTDEGRASLYYGNLGAGLAVVPRQLRVDAPTSIARLGASDRADAFRVRLGSARSPFGTATMTLETEVKPLGALLDGTGTELEGPIASTPSGVSIDHAVAGLALGGPYHWRARVRFDPASTPFQQRGRWISIPWGGRNESMVRTASSSFSPAGSLAATLVVGKAASNQVSLVWGPSCVGTDDDYAVYEGAIGTFTSHASRICSTGGTPSAILAPLAGDRYFLVVPRNAAREGSYGTDGVGNERPPGASQCAPQAIAACP